MLSSPARRFSHCLRLRSSLPLTAIPAKGLFRVFSTSHPCATPSADEYTADELRAARSWLAQLNSNTIPRNICDVSYSRSSGPGGQNVNKVNSKATLKVPLKSLLPFVPRVLHSTIQSSRYFANQSGNLVIQSDESRKQAKNLDLCYSKLRDLFVDAGKSAIPGETSEEQRGKVRKLQKAENEARLRMKKAHSSKKSSRSNRRDD